MGEGNSRTQQISLGNDFAAVLRYGGTIVELSPDGDVVVYTNGDVKVRPGANDDARPKAALEIGAVAPDGDTHAGLIYGGTLPSDKKPIWFSRLAPRSMNHFEAAAWAAAQGGQLPTREQGKHLDAIKDKGAFKELFNRIGSSSVWLKEPYINLGSNAWRQRLNTGDQDYSLYRLSELPVLCVVR